MNITRKIRIIELAIKLSCMAVIADLFYIIERVLEPVRTIDDAGFVCAVPEMLELMLLSAAVIAAFGAVAAYVLRGDTRYD